MELKINGLIRHNVQIVQAPKGTFVINEYGYYSFPMFCAICKPEGNELNFGDVLICPITDFNGGYASLCVDELKNELDANDFKRAVDFILENHVETEQEAFDIIISDFHAHGVIIHKRVKEYIKKQTKQ